MIENDIHVVANQHSDLSDSIHLQRLTKGLAQGVITNPTHIKINWQAWALGDTRRHRKGITVINPADWLIFLIESRCVD
mgnify:CR=1 FL=1